MQASDYYVDQLLSKSQYLRLQPAFDDPMAPALLRNRRIGIDVKQKEVLLLMQQFAEQVYQAGKGQILAFLGEEGKDFPA